MALIGESGHPIRSPLQERNINLEKSYPQKTRSPIKTTYSPSKTSLHQVSRSSPSRSRSPIKTVSSTEPIVSQNDIGSRNEKSEEIYNREVTEKKTTILDE